MNSLQGGNMDLLNWLAAFGILIVGAVLLLWTELLTRSKNYRVAIGGNILQALFVLVLVTGFFWSRRIRSVHWYGNMALDLLIIIAIILFALSLVMYFCSKFEKCRIILETRNCSMKEKRLYLYRRLQDMNAVLRFVYVAGKDISLWLLFVTVIPGLLINAFISDDASIILTGIWLLSLTSQVLKKHRDVKRKRKLLRRFENAS